MSGENSLLDSIRKGTETLHERLENNFDLFARARDVSSYAEVLRRFRAFYAAIEPRLLAIADPRLEEFRISERLKAKTLDADLAAISDVGETFALSDENVPAVKSFTDALGILYVLEGSTLGGQVITRHFQKTLPELSPARGLAFFNGYGTRTRERWMEFMGLLNARGSALSEDERSEVAQSARATFQAMESVLCGSPPIIPAV